MVEYNLVPTASGSEPPALPPILSIARAASAVRGAKAAGFAAFSFHPAFDDPERRATFEKVRSRIEAPKGIEAAASAEDDALLVLFVLCSMDTNRSVDVALGLALARGVPHAVDVAARLADVAIESVQAYRELEIDGKKVVVRASLAYTNTPGTSRGAYEFILRIGPYVRASSVDDRAAMRARVAPVFPQLPRSFRRAFASAFDDDEFIDGTLRDSLESGAAERHPTIPLRASDAGRVSEFVRRFARDIVLEHYSLQVDALARRHPAAAVEGWLFDLLEVARERGADGMITFLHLLANLRSARVAAEFGEALATPRTAPIADAYFERNRDLAALHLPEFARRRGKKWDGARALVARLAQAASEAQVEVTDRTAWPKILREAPWRTARAPIAELVLKPIEVEERILRVLAEPLPYKPGREEKAEVEYAARGPKQAHATVLSQLPPERVRELLVRDGHVMRLHGKDLAEVMARFGDELPSVGISIALHWPKRHVEFLTAVRSTRAARALVELADDPDLEREVMPALLREAETVALALIPLAFAPLGGRGAGETAKERYRAERILRRLAANGHADSVRSAAVRYGDAAVAAVEALAAIPREGFHPPHDEATPTFPDLSGLPPLLLRSGGALDAEGVARVLEMLRLAGADAYPGLVEVRDAVAPESADAFTWAVFAAWELADRVERWPIHAVGHLGGETSVRGLGRRIRDWPTNAKGVSRMWAALEALALNGSAEALMYLRSAGNRSLYADTRALVRQRFAAIAKERGLSVAQLHDRAVPTLGIEDGLPSLDMGSQRFDLRVDEGLDLHLIDATGKLLTKLPKPKKADDAQLAVAAKDRFDATLRVLTAVRESVCDHFEQAMRVQRSWSREDFDVLASHPLVGRIVRTLVWASDAELLRVDEDGRFATVDDLRWDAPERIRLAHPARDAGPAFERMKQLLLDYDIIHPMEQLTRAVHRLADEELHASECERVRGAKRGAAATLRLLEGGAWWVHEQTRDTALLATDVGVGIVTVEVRPGISVSYTHPGDRTFGTLRARDRQGAPMSFGSIDVVRLSELVRDLLTDWT